MGATVASWLVRSTPEWAVLVRALAGDIVLCSWARHLTLTVPLSTQVYKWVPANCWGNPPNCVEVTCNGLVSCPGEVEILLAASCYRNRDKPRQLWAILGSKASHSHILACLFVVISGDTPFYADSLVGTYGECMHYYLFRTCIVMLWHELMLIELKFAYNRCMTVFQ